MKRTALGVVGWSFAAAFSRVAGLSIVVGLSLASSACDFFGGGVDPDLGTRGYGDSCTDSRYCRTGLSCVMGTCRPSGTGVAGSFCTLTGDCAADLYCGPSRTCERAGASAEGGECASTADCQPGLLCRVEGFAAVCRAAGTGDLDDPCTTSLDCLAGLTCMEAGSARSCQSGPAYVLDDGGTLPPEIPAWPGATCEVDDGPPTAYFRVPRGVAADGDFFRLPFPNDARRVDGHLDLTGLPRPGTAVPVDVLGRTIDALEADVDGWSTNPVVYFRFSRAYDPDDIGAHVRWIDVTPGSPEYGRDHGLAWITTSGPLSRYLCPDWVAFRQGHGSPLRPGTTYAVILTSGITDAVANLPFQRSPDLDALLSDTEPGDAALTAAWSAYAPLRAWLATQTELPSRNVLNVALFTTQTIEGDVAAMREVIRARPTPTLSDVTVCGDGVTSPCDDGTPQRRCGTTHAAYTEIHARVSLPVFQDGTTAARSRGRPTARRASCATKACAW